MLDGGRGFMFLAETDAENLAECRFSFVLAYAPDMHTRGASLGRGAAKFEYATTILHLFQRCRGQRRTGRIDATFRIVIEPDTVLIAENGNGQAVGPEDLDSLHILGGL